MSYKENITNNIHIFRCDQALILETCSMLCDLTIGTLLAKLKRNWAKEFNSGWFGWAQQRTSPGWFHRDAAEESRNVTDLTPWVYGWRDHIKSKRMDQGSLWEQMPAPDDGSHRHEDLSSTIVRQRSEQKSWIRLGKDSSTQPSPRNAASPTP